MKPRAGSTQWYKQMATELNKFNVLFYYMRLRSALRFGLIGLTRISEALGKAESSSIKFSEAVKQLNEKYQHEKNSFNSITDRIFNR